MRKAFLILSLTLVFAIFGKSAFGQRSTPKFSSYPASIVKIKKNAPIRLTKADMQFRTRLRWATRDMKPNFAGHYILTAWGCGASCLGGAAIDALTGKVYSWKFSVCCWPLQTDENFRPIDFRLNSKLIRFTGLRNLKENDDGDHYYIFDSNKYQFLRTIN